MKAALEQANRLLAAGRRREAFAALRSVSVQELGRLLQGVPDHLAALRETLPEMPSDQVQRDWTGNSGLDLLQQTCAFVRSLEKAFANLTGRPLEGRTILDFGCGWGRMIRLMYHFSEPERIYGVDPWDLAIDICRGNRVLGNLALCDYVPRDLPFPGVTFDLVYAYSVFTHLSEKTADAAQRAIRARIHENGLFALTIRPAEYWTLHTFYPPGTSPQAMQARHREKGFAFIPHTRAPIDGDVTYGDTTMAVTYIERNWTGWQMAGLDPGPPELGQPIVLLRPR